MAFGSSASSETVIFRYPPRLDTFRKPIPGTGREVLVEDCLFAPGAGREVEVHAQQTQADATLFVPPDAPVITEKDQVMVRGEIYDVVEKPRLWLNEGIEVPLRFVRG